MIILFEYLEDLILKCVKENAENLDLYRAVVENKHPSAPCGSPDDLQWAVLVLLVIRCQKNSQNSLKYNHRRRESVLPTIDQRLVMKTTENIVYACFEGLIARNLAKDLGKRSFISPLVTRTCPLVLATFGIDYVERRGKVEWAHNNHNMESQLTQLTEIFRQVLNDSELEVITAKFARVTLVLSDSFVIDSIDEQNVDQIDRCLVGY